MRNQQILKGDCADGGRRGVEWDSKSKGEDLCETCFDRLRTTERRALLKLICFLFYFYFYFFFFFF